MEYHMLDMEHFPRRAHFEYFSAMDNPYVGVTVEVDITGFLRRCREKEYPFFLTFLHTVGQAANRVPQLRQRILNGGIAQFDHCDTSHTVLCGDGTYAYCRLACNQSLEEFLPVAMERHQKAKVEPTLDDGEDACSLLFVSCVPWISYTALVQPTPSPADSNPRITWGKFFTRDGRTLIPVTLLAHHALVDGMHLAAFYEELDRRLAQF